MKSVDVSLNTIDKIKRFVNVISTFDGDFDLSSGRYVVDAKSIMGIFSLDLSNDLRLDMYDDALADKVMAQIKEFMI